MNEPEKLCCFCSAQCPSREYGNLLEWCSIQCPHCGSYNISEIAKDTSAGFTEKHKAAISAFIRARQVRKLRPPTIVRDSSGEKDSSDTNLKITMQRVIDEHPIPIMISERLDRTLLNFSLMSEHPGAIVNVDQKDFPLVYAENPQTMNFLLRQLETDNLVQKLGSAPYQVVLTAKGWNRVAEIERGRLGVQNRQVFVAMWFDDSIGEIYEKGIKAAIEEAGYQPLRIDLKQHNNQITDEIVAEIRRSKFLVADMTGHRQGVYYEAGLMRGLGREVIFTCRKDELEKLHFDTRQFNHITWETAEELKEMLLQRIRATIFE